jgi:hypothetical protein
MTVEATIRDELNARASLQWLSTTWELRTTGGASDPSALTLPSPAPPPAIPPRWRSRRIDDWLLGRYNRMACRIQPATVLRITNQRLAGRSARRRMYQGNQCSP